MRRRVVITTSFFVFAIAILCAAAEEDKNIKQYAKGAVERGWHYFNNGNLDTALKRFNQATIIDPDFAPGYFGIAYVYSVQEKLDLAIENYRKTIELAPDFSHGYSNLGLALLYSGKPDEALSMLKKALEIDPENGDAHVNIAQYYFNMEDYVASWRHIHCAQDLKIKVNPDFLNDLRSKLPEPKRKTMKLKK